MLPVSAWSMSSSVGLGISFSSTAALIICPDWQYPHCGTSISSQARCKGWLRSGESPSMVVISFPAPRYRSHARAHRLAVNMDRACSALRHAASVLGSGQFQVFAQDPEQRSRRINIHIYATFIYAERNHWENLLWQKLSWLRSWLSSVTEQVLPRTSEKQQMELYTRRAYLGERRYG